MRANLEREALSSEMLTRLQMHTGGTRLGRVNLAGLRDGWRATSLRATSRGREYRIEVTTKAHLREQCCLRLHHETRIAARAGGLNSWSFPVSVPNHPFLRLHSIDGAVETDETVEAVLL